MNLVVSDDDMVDADDNEDDETSISRSLTNKKKDNKQGAIIVEFIGGTVPDRPTLALPHNAKENLVDTQTILLRMFEKHPILFKSAVKDKAVSASHSLYYL